MSIQEEFFHKYGKLSKPSSYIEKYEVQPTIGSGEIIRYVLGPGIEMSFLDYKVQPKSQISGFGNQNTMEFFYCLKGSVIMKFGKEKYSLPAGTLTVQDFNHTPDATIFTNDYLQGISLMIDINRGDQIISRYLGSDVVSIQKMLLWIKERKELFLVACEQPLTEVFLNIARSPMYYQLDYLKLKAMEIILICNGAMRKEKEHALLANRNDQKAIRLLYHFLQNNLAEELTIEKIAQETNIQPGKVKRLVRANYQSSVHAYLKEMRLTKAKKLLLETDQPITMIASDVGWQNASKFSAAFKCRFGLPPKEFRKGKIMN